MSTSGQTSNQTVRQQLEAITTEATRKTLTGPNVLHFVPINVKALEVTLGKTREGIDRLIFTQTDQAELEAELEAALAAAEQVSSSSPFTFQPQLPKGLEIGKNKKSKPKLEPQKPLIDFEDLRKRLVSFIKSTHPYKIIRINKNFYSSTDKTTVLTGNSIRANCPAVVYENNEQDDNIIGALYSSYTSTRENLFRDFLNKEINKFINKKLYTDQDRTGAFDVGHILSNSGGLGKTAIAERLRRVIVKIQEVIGSGNQTAQQLQILQQLKTDTQSILAELKEKSQYGPKIEAELHQDTTTALSSVGAIIVVIQERRENQVIYGSIIEGSAGRRLNELLAQLGFSKSLVQNIELRIHEALKHGKVITRGKRGKKFISTEPTKLKPATVVGSKTKITTNIRPKALPKLKTPISAGITQLQQLLDASLVQQVKQNMGSGSRRDILNLRSGRFAESVEATRVSQSKQGAITVFYSYMKNPYATFSEGGRQQYPRSRDPKLLISRSIRELAVQQMITKLRTVAQ